MPVCIVYATTKGREFSEDQTEWKAKWDNDTLYYNIIGICRTMSIKEVKKALNYAMTTWDLEIDIHFYPTWYGHASQDLTIDFKDIEEDDLFKTNPNVLAYAYFPGQGNVSGKVVFNNNYIWTMNGKTITGKEAKKKGWVEFADDTVQLRTYNLITVLIHELGHSLGLKHDVTGKSDGRDVMDAYYDGALDLSDRDIYRILLKYPRRIFSRWSHYARLKKWLRRKKLRF